MRPACPPQVDFDIPDIQDLPPAGLRFLFTFSDRPFKFKKKVGNSMETVATIAGGKTVAMNIGENALGYEG